MVVTAGRMTADELDLRAGDTLTTPLIPGLAIDLADLFDR